MYDVLKVFKDVRMKDGKEEHFMPYSDFDDEKRKWFFRSRKTGKVYDYSELMIDSVNPNLNDVFAAYRAHAKMGSTIWTTAEFVCYWVAQTIHMNALYAADNARIEFLEKSLTSDLNKKQVGKVNKSSEDVYEQAHAAYLKIHEDK